MGTGIPHNGYQEPLASPARKPQGKPGQQDRERQYTTMKYEYTFRNTAGDYAQFYLGNTYHSMMAAVNVIFTAAMIALAVAKFGSFGIVARALNIFGIILFPVIQPLAIYLRSMKDAERVNKVDTWIGFDDAGMHIRVKDHEQLIRWNDFYPIVKRKSMLVVAPDGIHAYILTNRILGETKDDLYAYAAGRINALSVHKDGK
jgi:hypothetical protein